MHGHIGIIGSVVVYTDADGRRRPAILTDLGPANLAELWLPDGTHPTGVTHDRRRKPGTYRFRTHAERGH